MSGEQDGARHYSIRVVESDVYVVAADFVGFVVKRLGDVADEVDEKSESIVYFLVGKGARLYSCCVICNGADRAAFSSAVSIIVYTAARWSGADQVRERDSQHRCGISYGLSSASI